MTHAASRYKYGNLEYCEPSRFLEEIPQNLVTYVGYNKSKWQDEKNVFDKAYEHATPVAKAKPIPPVQNYVHAPSAGFKVAFPEELKPGMEIEHQKFGFGKITAMEGQNEGQMATIQFYNAGQKKLLLKFAKLSIVSM